MNKFLAELDNPFNTCAHKQQCIDRIAELEQKAGAERMETARVRAALATRDKEYQLEHDLRVELDKACHELRLDRVKQKKRCQRLRDALELYVHLDLCDMEGLAPPTTKQWTEAHEKAVSALEDS